MIPRNWFYHIALILPFVFRLLMLNTDVVDWLWYHHYEQTYYALATLRIQPQFLTFVGGWKLPLFIASVLCWWHVEDGDGIPAQFLLLPLGYVPFTMIGDLLANGGLSPDTNFYVYPLVILPVGYAYVLAWSIVIWLLGKLGLVIS